MKVLLENGGDRMAAVAVEDGIVELELVRVLLRQYQVGNGDKLGNGKGSISTRSSWRFLPHLS